MERHVYKFEFKYDKQVNGKKTEFTVPVIVHNECYMDACTKVDEFVRKNFADRVTEESTIKYVGEFVHGVLKPFVEMKEEKQMKTYLEMYDEMVGVHKKVELLENRVEYFEKKQEDLKPVKTEGYFVVRNINHNSCYNISLIPRGSGKHKVTEEIRKAELDARIRYCDDDFNILKRACEMVEKQQVQVFDVASMYPQAVDVCKVYQIERDQALKENEAINKNRKLMRVDLENSEKMNRLLVKENEKLCENIRFMDKENWSLLNAVEGYKKELSQLNLLMDDMENRLEKQVVARDGMLKQLREYKAEKKRMNKIIDALTEVEK